MIIDTHCHVIATDTKKYPLKPLFGKQSDWSAEHPLDYPDMVKAGVEAGVDKSVLVQASSAYDARQLLCGGFGRGASGALYGCVLDRRGGIRCRRKDEALDGPRPDRHAHLHLGLDPCLAGDLLRRRGGNADVDIRQRPGPVGLHADARRRTAAAGEGDQALSEGAHPARPLRARGSRRWRAFPLRRSVVGAGEVSDRLSQAHPPADRAIREGSFDAGAVPRQGHQGVRRATHHLGLELPGRQTAPARADQDGAKRAFPSSRLRIKIGFSTRPR